MHSFIHSEHVERHAVPGPCAVVITVVVIMEVVVLFSSSPGDDDDVTAVTSLAGPAFHSAPIGSCVSVPPSLTNVLSLAGLVAMVIASPTAGCSLVEVVRAEAPIGGGASELLPLLVEATPSGTTESRSSGRGFAVETLGGVAAVVLVMPEKVGICIRGRRSAKEWPPRGEGGAGESLETGS